VADDSKQAEKAYLSRAGTARWERVKPFSSPGHHDVSEGARLIHDFAVALLCLEPAAGARVLDLGAGSCWASEWLARFNFQTLSVDIAHDMLAIGQTRLGGSAWVVAGDLERLPISDASIDYAMCLNALHHVPDTAAAVREAHRVLRPGGRVVFGEPGRGHADQAQAQTATGEWGVQERELPPEVLLDACHRAGFCHVVLKPLTAAVPWYEVDAQRWRQWHRHAATRRPLRAAGRMSRAVLEAFGLGKGGVGFEDALGMELIRIVGGAVDSHPFVVATK
jgi:ubiquinone/menaquinone biosynthesis C-methylase UbiE